MLPLPSPGGPSAQEWVSTGLSTTQAACTQCPVGKYTSQEGWGVCQECGLGHYQDQAGQLECLVCPDGKVAESTGRASCVHCADGWIPNPRRDGCVACPAGTFLDQVGDHVCTLCPIGKHTTSQGRTECDNCTPGKFTNLIGTAAACTPCPGGYISGTSAWQCTACQPGAQSNAAGDACVPCQPGSVSQGASPTCDACGPGKFMNSTEGTECASCPDGQVTNVKGSEACAVCPAGKFSSRDRRTCVSCPMGKYQDRAGQTDCVVCPEGTFASEEGRTNCSACARGSFIGVVGESGSCTNCPAGYISGIGDSGCEACPVGKYATAQGDQCLPCELGKFNNREAQAQCVDCDVGTFANETGLVVCRRCAEGKVAVTQGLDVCTPCAAGLYADEENKQCLQCAPGSNSSAGASSCVACLLGTVQPSTGRAQCVPCPSGRYIAQTGRTSCFECPAGYITPREGMWGCGACPRGTIAAIAGLDTCAPCDPGTYMGRQGADACLPCRKGTYADGSGLDRCTLCAPGEVAPEEGMPRCVECEAGKFSADDRVSCLPCPAGQHASWNGTATCNLCVPGTAAPAKGTTNCTDCPAGSFAAQYGRLTCDLCPAGSVTATAGQSACTPCRPGWHAFWPGMTECLQCPAGTVAGLAGQAFCYLCPAGKFSNTNSTACLPCPAGLASGAGSATCFACPNGTTLAGDQTSCERPLVDEALASASDRAAIDATSLEDLLAASASSSPSGRGMDARMKALAPEGSAERAMYEWFVSTDQAASDYDGTLTDEFALRTEAEGGGDGMLSRSQVRVVEAMESQKRSLLALLDGVMLQVQRGALGVEKPRIVSGVTIRVASSRRAAESLAEVAFKGEETGAGAIGFAFPAGVVNASATSDVLAMLVDFAVDPHSGGSQSSLQRASTVSMSLLDAKTMQPITVSGLTDPVVFDLPVDDGTPSSEVRCVYWSSRLQRWTTAGLALREVRRDAAGQLVARCSSTHLTEFTALGKEETPLRLVPRPSTLSDLSVHYVVTTDGPLRLLFFCTVGLALAWMAITVYECSTRHRRQVVVHANFIRYGRFKPLASRAVDIRLRREEEALQMLRDGPESAEDVQSGCSVCCNRFWRRARIGDALREDFMLLSLVLAPEEDLMVLPRSQRLAIIFAELMTAFAVNAALLGERPERVRDMSAPTLLALCCMGIPALVLPEVFRVVNEFKSATLSTKSRSKAMKRLHANAAYKLLSKRRARIRYKDIVVGGLATAAAAADVPEERSVSEGEQASNSYAWGAAPPTTSRPVTREAVEGQGNNDGTGVGGTVIAAPKVQLSTMEALASLVGPVDELSSSEESASASGSENGSGWSEDEGDSKEEGGEAQDSAKPEDLRTRLARIRARTRAASSSFNLSISSPAASPLSSPKRKGGLSPVKMFSPRVAPLLLPSPSRASLTPGGTGTPMGSEAGFQDLAAIPSGRTTIRAEVSSPLAGGEVNDDERKEAPESQAKEGEGEGAAGAGSEAAASPRGEDGKEGVAAGGRKGKKGGKEPTKKKKVSQKLEDRLRVLQDQLEESKAQRELLMAATGRGGDLNALTQWECKECWFEGNTQLSKLCSLCGSLQPGASPAEGTSTLFDTEAEDIDLDALRAELVNLVSLIKLRKVLRAVGTVLLVAGVALVGLSALEVFWDVWTVPIALVSIVCGLVALFSGMRALLAAPAARIGTLMRLGVCSTAVGLVAGVMALALVLELPLAEKAGQELARSQWSQLYEHSDMVPVAHDALERAQLVGGCCGFEGEHDMALGASCNATLFAANWSQPLFAEKLLLYGEDGNATDIVGCSQFVLARGLERVGPLLWCSVALLPGLVGLLALGIRRRKIVITGLASRALALGSKMSGSLYDPEHERAAIFFQRLWREAVSHRRKFRNVEFRQLQAQRVRRTLLSGMIYGMLLLYDAWTAYVVWLYGIHLDTTVEMVWFLASVVALGISILVVQPTLITVKRVVVAGGRPMREGICPSR